jgi:hypothetical protein
VLGIYRGLVGQFYRSFDCLSFLLARLLCLKFTCVKMRIVAMTLRRNRLNHPAHVRCTLGAGLGLHEYGILGTGRGRRRWKAIDIEARWLVNGGHGASLRHHGVRRPEGGKR